MRLSSKYSVKKRCGEWHVFRQYSDGYRVFRAHFPSWEMAIAFANMQARSARSR